MSSSDVVIEAKNLSKQYDIYAKPSDRLRQLVLSGILRATGAAVRPRSAREARTARTYFQKFSALSDVSFSVRKGEAVGIVGRNGAGKSTLLQLICGTLTPTSGQVHVKGRISALLELGSGFNPEYTGRQNVYLNGQLLGLSRAEIDRRYSEILEFADIGEFVNRPVKTYSSGMVVRLAFAVATQVEPEILIIDEALAVGDMAFQVKCFDQLRRLRSKGVSILFVSHVPGVVRSFCDHAIYLDHGRCIASGPVNEVVSRYELDALRQKLSPIDTIDRFAVDSIQTSNGKQYETAPQNVFDLLLALRNSLRSDDHAGTSRIRIESLVVTDGKDVPVESVSPLEKITVYALLKFNFEFAADIHFSMQVHDRQGYPLIVIRDTHFEETVIRRAGDFLICAVSTSLPLQAGSYYIRAAVLTFPPGGKYVDAIFNFEDAEISDLVERAAFVEVLPYTRHPIPSPVLNEAKLRLMVGGT